MTENREQRKCQLLMDKTVGLLNTLAVYWFKLSRSSKLLAYTSHCHQGMEAFIVLMYGKELACNSNVLNVLHRNIANPLQVDRNPPLVIFAATW